MTAYLAWVTKFMAKLYDLSVPTEHESVEWNLVPRMRPASGTHPCVPIISNPVIARMSLRRIRGTTFNPIQRNRTLVRVKAGTHGRSLDSCFPVNDGRAPANQMTMLAIALPREEIAERQRYSKPADKQNRTLPALHSDHRIGYAHQGHNVERHPARLQGCRGQSPTHLVYDQ